MSLVSSSREATEMVDLEPSTDGTKKRPRYYEGVYSNERTISTKGGVTPISLSSPISRGIFNLPRYVPKYTINSRLRGRYADEVASDSNTSQTFDRKYQDAKYADVPIFPDKPEDVETSNSETKTKEVKGRKKSRREAESENRRECCSKCSSAKCCIPRCCTPRCCTPNCCTPKCRRIVCPFVIVALVAAALLALALGLYFGYFMQFGGSYPMTANFTVTNVTFPGYLSDLSNPQTLNLTNAVCDAFRKTLENVSQIYVDVSSCSAVSYTSGSIYAIFNIEVRRRRDQFFNSDDAFASEVRDRLKTEFNLTPAGYFAMAISRSIPNRYKPTGEHFNVVLNGVSSGHFSPQNKLWTSTVTTTPTSVTKTTKSITTSSISMAKTTSKNSATSTERVTTTDNSNSRNTSVTANGAVNTTITSRLTKTPEPSPSALATTSLANTSRTVDPPSSVHTDYSVTMSHMRITSTTIKPSSTQTIRPSSTNHPTTQPSSTQSPTIQPSSTQSPTIQPSSTQSPTIQPSSTQSPTIQPSSTQSPTIQPSSTQSPTIQPSSTQRPTIQPSSTQHPTTTVPAHTTTATVHHDVSTTATTTVAAVMPHMIQPTTSESRTSRSHLTASSAALTSSSH